MNKISGPGPHTLKRLAACFLVLFFACSSPVFSQVRYEDLAEEDRALLEKIQKAGLNYFIKERASKTGLIRDKADNFQKDGLSADASIAATGFALAAYAVGVERGWLDRGSAMAMTRQVLQFFWKDAEQVHGFFYHFLEAASGTKTKNSEVSPIDTALLLAGAVFAAEYYGDATLRDLVGKIYERVEWDWMLHGKETLCMSWSPQQGFNKRHWDNYDEAMIMYLLAIGSPTHPIPPASWQAIHRPAGSYREYRLIQMPPLFTHQYSHIFMDFRNKNDGHADYFKNSVNATLANRAFCLDQASKFSTYGPDVWGLTASDGPFGYKAYGAPPGWAVHDGTVAPTACGSSIVFTPEESMACLRHLDQTFGKQLWGLYGFSDAFNTDKQWFSRLVFGIDQGPLVLMIENFRSGLVWKTMEEVSFLRESMARVGFVDGSIELPWPDPPVYEAPYVKGGIEVDGYLKDWPNVEPIKLDRSNTEFGYVDSDADLSAKVRFAWDEKALYFIADVKDDFMMARKSGKNIWQDDLIEIYVNPGGDGLRWKDPKDFQIGFRPTPGEDYVEIWSWFQNDDRHLQGGAVTARGYCHEKGYLIEGAVRWDSLGMEAKPGMTLRLSVAVNDVDKDRSVSKLQWFFRNEKDYQRFELGRLVLKN
jgi:hypothetical protein